MIAYGNNTKKLIRRYGMDLIMKMNIWVTVCMFAVMMLGGCAIHYVPEKLTEPVTLTVYDSQGVPLAGVVAKVYSVYFDEEGNKLDSGSHSITSQPSDGQGKIIIQAEAQTKSRYDDIDLTKCQLGYDIYLHGENIPDTEINAKESEFPLTVTLKPVVTVKLKLEGQTVNGYPKIGPAHDTFYALYDKTVMEILPQKLGNDSWQVKLAAGDSYVVGWISDKMYGYQSKPFVATEGLEVVFMPGMPGSLEYDCSNPPAGCKTIYPVEPFIGVWYVNDGKENHLSCGGKFKPEKLTKPGKFIINGLAGGKYHICFQTDNIDYSKPYLYDRRDIVIEPGIVNKIMAKYPVIDTTVEPGDVTIRGTVMNATGEPLAGQEVNIRVSVINDFGKEPFYPHTFSDSNGKYEIAGIRPGLDLYLKCGENGMLISSDSTAPDTIITLDVNPAGKKVAEVIIGKTIPDIPLIWQDGSKGNLSDLHGKVVVIDFWSTWCKGCVEGLPHFNDLAKENSLDKQIVFVAISEDTVESKWQKFLSEKNLTAIRHALLDDIKTEYYIGKNAIPFYMVLMPDGTIKAADNSLDIEAVLTEITGRAALPDVPTIENSFTR